MLSEQKVSESCGTLEGSAIGEFAGGIDGSATVFVTPLADATVVFESEAKRVHAAMA